MKAFVVLFVEGHGRARQKGQTTHFIEHGASHPAVGEVFKLHTLRRIVGLGGFQQTQHADLDQLVEFHEGRHTGFEVNGHAFDQAQMGQHQFITLGLALLVHGDRGKGSHRASGLF